MASYCYRSVYFAVYAHCKTMYHDLIHPVTKTEQSLVHLFSAASAGKFTFRLVSLTLAMPVVTLSDDYLLVTCMLHCCSQCLHTCQPLRFWWTFSAVISSFAIPILAFILLFTARCTKCKARSCDRMSSVRPSVCPSVTFVICDHIGWISWKLIARTISPAPSLFVAKRRST